MNLQEMNALADRLDGHAGTIDDPSMAAQEMHDDIRLAMKLVREHAKLIDVVGQMIRKLDRDFREVTGRAP